MNPIDADRNRIDFIRQKQPDTIESSNNPRVSPRICNTGDQLIDLLALVKKSPESTTSPQRLNEIKTEIHSNSYSIDFDELINNILASDYEF